MQIHHFLTSPLQTNTYVVENNGKAFVVDPGGSAEEIYRFLCDRKLFLDAILLTHAHFDHMGGVAELLKMVVQDVRPSVLVHKDDADKIGSYKNLAFSMGATCEKFEPDILLNGDEKLRVADLDVRVIHTPGHSKGGVCYVCGDRIFVGDTIFCMSYGRYDFYDGDFDELKNSIINKIFRLEGNYVLLPGHGDPTSLSFERKNNAILTDEKTPSIID